MVIATRNAHKVREIRGILGEEHRYLTLSDFPGAPEIVEDGGSFAGNATKKAVELARWLSSQSARESLHPENSSPPHPTLSQRERESNTLLRKSTSKPPTSPAAAPRRGLGECHSLIR